MPEDLTKLSIILHWISNVISSGTAASLSFDESSGRLTFYLCSNAFHEPSTENATRLLDIMRKSFSIALTGENQSDLEQEYLVFVADVCWQRLQDKVNNKVPHFPLVPDGADVSTMSSVLKTIVGLVEAWKAWRLQTGLPDEDSPIVTKMRQKLSHSQSSDTLKHCFEEIFRPLDDSGNRLHQLHRLWRCCYALMKSDFFSDVFNERWGDYYSLETCFLYRVYRRIWRLYSYRRGMDVLLRRGIPHLISMGCQPDITFCWVPCDSPSTIELVTTPEHFIFQAGQRRGWPGNLAQDSPSTSAARRLWSVNETKVVNVHPVVSLVNFLHSSGIRVMENRIGTSRRPCTLCGYYATSIDNWIFQCARSSNKFRVDWAVPQMFGGTLTKDMVERIIAKIRDYAEAIAVAFLTPLPQFEGYLSDME